VIRAATRLLPALLLAGCSSGAGPLDSAGSWAIQLQGLERPGAPEALAAHPARLLVIEQTRGVKGLEDYPAAATVAALRASGKICLAYFNVGQGETYRTYWDAAWSPPTGSARGSPDFLLAADPDGWPGNYPVAFWDPRWRAILLAALDEVVADGFDGIFVDGVLGYSHPPVAAAALEEGVDPAGEMVELLAALRARAPRRFLLVALNALDLGEEAPGFYDLLDGYAQESPTFSGIPTPDWDDPMAGDQPGFEAWSGIERFRARGIPVFTLDYALLPANAALAAEASRAHGCVPFVSRTPLDRLP
jgi:cysteinyl-tRNA synthetase